MRTVQITPYISEQRHIASIPADGRVTVTVGGRRVEGRIVPTEAED